MTNLKDDAPQPWLSVITVVKDDHEGLLRTRDSLTRQDLTGVQWVVVDSSKISVSELAEIPDVETLYTWTEPHGIYSAMNTALDLCTGTYAWFVNAGDEATRNAVGSLKSELLHTDLLWLVGQVRFMDESNRGTTPAPYDHKVEASHAFARGRFPPHQGTVVKTQALRDLGGFDESYKIAADYELALRLSKLSEPLITHDVLADFHFGGISTSRWLMALSEFHRARKSVLQLRGPAAAKELGWTAYSFAKGAFGSVLRKMREN